MCSTLEVGVIRWKPKAYLNNRINDDDFIFGRKKTIFNKMIFMGLSAGAYFVLDPERTLDNGVKVKPIGEVVPNIGVTLGIVF